jgi:transposase
MPKLLFARSPQDNAEERQVRKLAGARHAPADWIRRAQMIVRSWDRERTTAIAAVLQCHPQTVRERIIRFNAEGIDGLGDRPGAGRKPRLTEDERSIVVALAHSTPPGRLVRQPDGALRADAADKEAQWSLDALTEEAHTRGIVIARSQIRRILQKEGIRWRRTHPWATSTDPDFAPKGRGSSPAPPTRPSVRRPCASTSLAR